MKRFFDVVSLENNEIKKVRIDNRDSQSVFPVPLIGQVYYDTTLNRLRCYNGTRWEDADAKNAMEFLNGDGLIDYINESGVIRTINNNRLTNSTFHLGSTLITLGELTSHVEGLTLSVSTIDGTLNNTFYFGDKGAILTSNLKETENIELQVKNFENNALANIRTKNTITKKVEAEEEQRASVFYNKDINKWQLTYINSSGEIFTNTIARTFTTHFGNGMSNEFTIHHNLNTKNLAITVREAKTEGEVVLADVILLNDNSVKISTSIIPALNEFAITIVG